jgi:hypothetical protein
VAQNASVVTDLLLMCQSTEAEQSFIKRASYLKWSSVDIEAYHPFGKESVATADRAVSDEVGGLLSSEVRRIAW